MNKKNNYSCECAPGWEGRTCEISKLSIFLKNQSFSTNEVLMKSFKLKQMLFETSKKMEN